MATESDATSRRVSAPDVALRKRVRVADLALLGAVPAVLGLVFSLPAATRRSLVFDYASPTAPTAVVSALVHFDPVHLSANVVLYGLLAATALALGVASGRRRRFYTVFLTFVLAFPGVLSYLNLAIPRSATTFGFSGVAMAFAGYLPLALAEYAEFQFDIGPRTAVAPLLAFLSLGLIAALSVQSVVAENATVLLGTSGLVVATVLAALLYAVSLSDAQADFATKLATAAERTGHFELAVVGLVLVFGIPFVAFPADPNGTSTAVNLYVHLLGYTLGFLVTYVTSALGLRVEGA